MTPIPAAEIHDAGRAPATELRICSVVRPARRRRDAPRGCAIAMRLKKHG
jgi:hypothetical protein